MNFQLITRSYPIFLLVFFLPFIYCCTTQPSKQITKNSEDSLHQLCEKLMMERNVDSLREIATLYMNSLAPDSKEYFKAYQYRIVADFNAKNYDKVIEQIDQVAKQSAFQTYPDIMCSYLYTRSRALQYSGKNKAAIESFKEILTFNSDIESIRENIRGVTLNGLLQMMNTYQVSGNTAECVEYLTALENNPTPIIKDYCMRDVHSLLAYSLYRNGQRKKAEKYIEETLAMPDYKPSPEKTFRDNSYAAAIFYGNAEKQDKVIEWSKIAMDAANSYKYTGGVQWLTTLLGSIYQQIGRIEEAVELHNKSIALAKEQNDLSGEANAYISLTNLYLYWELYDQANEYATISLQKNLSHKKRSESICGDSYLTKGKVMNKMGMIDSAYYYWQLADSSYSYLPYSAGQCEVDKYMGELILEHDSIGSSKDGIRRLHRVVNESQGWSDKACSYFWLAKEYISQNKTTYGEALLDSMYSILNASSSPYIVEGANRFALNHYLQKNDLKNIKRYADTYMHETDIRFDEQISKKVTEAMIQYQTEKKEQQLLLAQAELTNKELNLQVHMLLLIVLLTALLLGTGWFFYKRRLYLIKNELAEHRISSLVSDFQEASTRSILVEKQMKELLSDKDNYLQISTITPKLFRESGENKFRERFALLYPGFLSALRERIPTITPSEEILSMLIILEQSTEQMVDILCIARGSVNMARHRLRQKMGLQKEESLDDVIKGLIK